MPYVYITSFSGPPATITVCDTLTQTICYTYPTQLTDLGPFPFIINLPSPDFDLVGDITLTAQSANGCSIVQSNVCSILPSPTPTSAPVPCFEVVINGDFDGSLSGWSASNPTYWTWDSFSGGSAIWTGMDDSQNELTQTGYTFIDGFSYTINYDVYNTDPLGGFVWAQLGVNTSIDISQPIPISPVSAWTQYSTNLLCAGGTQLSMNGSSDTLPVYLDNVSACFTYGPCYYMEFGTNENFGVLGTGEVQYLDCNGVLQTYSAATAGNFYLCAVQSPGAIDIDVIGEEYLCENVGGDWYGPTLESPTPTPSNPPTPTPSPAAPGFIYETITFDYSFGSTSTNRYTKLMITSVGEYVGSAAKITYGGGELLFTLMGGTNYYIVPVTGTSGQIVISATTSTPGLVESIGFFRTQTNTGFTNSAITGYTSELSKLVNTQGIGLNIGYYTNGNIQELSGLTNCSGISFLDGNFTGDIQHLPNSIATIQFGSNESRSSNTVYGDIANLPTSIESMSIYGLNTISGNVSSITSFFQNQVNGEFTLNGHNTITGIMSDIPNIPIIQIDNRPPDNSYYSNKITGNTISGNLTLKSKNLDVIIGGGNTITGNLATTQQNPWYLTNLRIAGLNTIGGNVNLLKLPKEWFELLGDNVVTGNVNDIITNALIKKIEIRNRGQYGTSVSFVNSGNTLSGNIDAFQTCVSMENLLIGGNNTITGDISSLLNISPTWLKVLFIVSNNNTINAANFTPSSPSIFSSNVLNPFRWILRSNNTGNAMNTVQIDKLLTYINTYKTANIPQGATLYIDGSGYGVPSATGLSIITTLESRNVAVSHN